MLAVTLVVVGALVAVAGCGGSDDDSGGGKSKGGGSGSGTAPVETFQAGDSISVANGDTFVIALEANPSTGYTWSAAANPNATFVSSKQVAGQSMPGAPGTQQLTFEATASGSSTLVLSYARSFESGVPPVQTESFPLTVK
jgi:inhibitor of cysteine peptidase